MWHPKIWEHSRGAVENKPAISQAVALSLECHKAYEPLQGIVTAKELSCAHNPSPRSQ